VSESIEGFPLFPLGLVLLPGGRRLSAVRRIRVL